MITVDYHLERIASLFSKLYAFRKEHLHFWLEAEAYLKVKAEIREHEVLSPLYVSDSCGYVLTC